MENYQSASSSPYDAIRATLLKREFQAREKIREIFREEEAIEQDEQQIEEQQRKEISEDAKKELEKQRWAIEDRRREIKQKRWDAEKEQKTFESQLTKVKDYVVLQKELLRVIAQEEQIEMQKSQVEQKEAPQERSDVLGRIQKELTLVIAREQELEAKQYEIEKQEWATQDEREKRTLEEQRWKVVDERRAAEQERMQVEDALTSSFQTLRVLESERTGYEEKRQELEKRRWEIQDQVAQIEQEFPEFVSVKSQAVREQDVSLKVGQVVEVAVEEVREEAEGAPTEERVPEPEIIPFREQTDKEEAQGDEVEEITPPKKKDVEVKEEKNKDILQGEGASEVYGEEAVRTMKKDLEQIRKERKE